MRSLDGDDNNNGSVEAVHKQSYVSRNTRLSGNMQDQSNKHYCDCPGNLDPAGCGKVGCRPGGLIVTELGPFWSPGYNGNVGTYGADLECRWIMRPPMRGQTVNITAHYFKTSDDAILTIQSSTGATLTLSGDYEAYLPILNTRLGNAVQGADTVTFTFRSTTAGAVNDYFDFGFLFVTTTTTTTPTITTTNPSRPCTSDQMCKGPLGYSGTCKTNQTSTNYCNCPGNLDPAGCGKVGCRNVAESGLPVNELGPFWSPGYNGKDGTYGAGLECQWVMRSPIGGQTVNVTVYHFKTKDDDFMTVQSSTGGTLTLSGDYENYMGILNTRLQNTVNGADIVTFTFRSTTAGFVGDYFDFGFSFL